MKNLIKKIASLLIICLCFSSGIFAQNTKTIWLDDLPIKSFSEGIPSVSAKTNAGGDSIRMNGKLFKHGIGVSSTSVLSFFLDGHATKFTAIVGVDDKGVKDLPLNFM